MGGRNGGRGPVDLGGVPILGGEGPVMEPVPRALLSVSDRQRRVFTEPATVSLPPVAGSVGLPADARVIGDSGEVALWTCALVMLHNLQAEQRALVARLEAAGVIPPVPPAPSERPTP